MWPESTGEVNHKKERNLLSHCWHYLGMSCCLIEAPQSKASGGRALGELRREWWRLSGFLHAVTFERCLSLALIDLLPHLRGFYPNQHTNSCATNRAGEISRALEMKPVKRIAWFQRQSINALLCAGCRGVQLQGGTVRARGSAAQRSQQLCSTSVL